MTLLEATSDLYNPAEYGRVTVGQTFSCKDSIAIRLVKKGVARRVIFETALPEVVALTGEPFCDVYLPNAEPSAMAAEGYRVLSGSGLSESRAPDPGKRSGAGKHSKRSKDSVFP